jgi:hypothetical protein
MKSEKKCSHCDKTVTTGQYRRDKTSGEIICRDCFIGQEFKNRPIEVEVMPAVRKENPFLARAKVKPMDEIVQKVALEGKMETLQDVVRGFEQLREIAAAMGKKNDIYHVNKIDMYLQEVLEIITGKDAIDGLTKNIIQTMATGDLREVNAIIKTVRDLAETKELLSQSFDDNRSGGGQRKHLKLQLAFTNKDGSMMAAKVES